MSLGVCGPVCVSHHLQSISTWPGCVHHRSVEIAALQIPPGSPRRTACKTYQDLCICIQSLLRWTRRWKCHEAAVPPFQTVFCPTNTCGFKVVICRRPPKRPPLFDSHMEVLKGRFRAGNLSLESIHLGNCDIVTWEKHKGGCVTRDFLMLNAEWGYEFLSAASWLTDSDWFQLVLQ